MFRRLFALLVWALLFNMSFGVADAFAGRRINERASDQAMAALRLDFARDGVLKTGDDLIRLYNAACEQGYRPACGWRVWHEEADSRLDSAASVFSELCGPDDAMACVVWGWSFEEMGDRQEGDKERSRLYFRAAVLYKQACDTSGLTGIAGCYELARLRAVGKGMPVAVQAAYELFEWTCNAGYLMACVGLGDLMPQALTFVPDADGVDQIRAGTAADMYKRACDGGLERGCYHFGRLHSNKWSDAEKRKWFDDLCKRGDRDACLELAALYSVSTSSPADTSLRMEALGRGCDLGGGEACFRVGLGHANGEYGPPNLDWAVEKFTHGCDLGSADACANLGQLISSGKAGGDRSVALPYLEKGCTGGVVASCVQLGSLYLNGDGIEVDSARARELLSIGCDDDGIVLPAACKGLARIFGEGRGFPRDRVEAARFLGISCERGDLDACYRQGEQLYDFSSDGRYDDVAHGAYRMACDGGITPACVKAGLLREHGAARIRDVNVASEYYDKACGLGLASGCLYLGSVKERGAEGLVDFEAARSAFERGRGLGDLEAQRQVARMMWYGLGGKRQRGAARKLYRDACQKGNSRACAGWRM